MKFESGPTTLVPYEMDETGLKGWEGPRTFPVSFVITDFLLGRGGRPEVVPASTRKGRIHARNEKRTFAFRGFELIANALEAKRAIVVNFYFASTIIFLLFSLLFFPFPPFQSSGRISHG